MKNGAFNYAYGANVNNSSNSRLCEACLGYETGIGYLKLFLHTLIPISIQIADDVFHIGSG